MADKFLQIGWSIEGEKQISRGFDFVGKELSNLTQPLTKARDLLLKTFKENMDKEGGIFGQWAPLSPRYAEQKAEKYPGTKILERTGLMRRSFKTLVSSTSATLWNPTTYFAFHQSNKARRRLPRRLMMKIDDARRKEILRFFTEYLNEVRGHFMKGK
jgi:phage gpG-like protein